MKLHRPLESSISYEDLKGVGTDSISLSQLTVVHCAKTCSGQLNSLSLSCHPRPLSIGHDMATSQRGPLCQNHQGQTTPYFLRSKITSPLPCYSRCRRKPAAYIPAPRPFWLQPTLANLVNLESLVIKADYLPRLEKPRLFRRPEIHLPNHGSCRFLSH